MFSTLNMKNFIIAGHEHSTRDSRGQRLISINPVVNEQNHRDHLKLLKMPCRRVAMTTILRILHVAKK